MLWSVDNHLIFYCDNTVNTIDLKSVDIQTGVVRTYLTSDVTRGGIIQLKALTGTSQPLVVRSGYAEQIYLLIDPLTGEQSILDESTFREKASISLDDQYRVNISYEGLQHSPVSIVRWRPGQSTGH
jgi:hypothetical protein